MNKKALSVIMTIVLTVITSGNTFASPSTSSSDTLQQTQDNKKELQSKVQTLDKQIDEVLAKIDSNKKDMNIAAQNIKHTQIKLDAAEKNSIAQNDLFKKRVRGMYISGTDSYLQVLLASDNLSDFMSRFDMITQVIKFDNQVITKLKEKKQTIANEKQALNNENNKLEALKTSNENTLSKLSKDIKEQKELLSKTTEKEKQLLAANASKQLAYNDSKSFKGGTLSRGISTSVSYSQVLDLQATAYSGDGITASGAATQRDPDGYSTIAVDPRVIPIGSTVYVEGYGYAVAQDTGGAIKGNIIDVFFHSESEASNWGRRSVKVYILK
jgi:peptidoglycan DL-endopeptidase CwlO